MKNKKEEKININKDNEREEREKKEKRERKVTMSK